MSQITLTPQEIQYTAPLTTPTGPYSSDRTQLKKIMHELQHMSTKTVYILNRLYYLLISKEPLWISILIVPLPLILVPGFLLGSVYPSRINIIV